MGNQTVSILLVISCFLFILSFFRKDRNKEVDEQIENFSITLMQEIYQLKKKIKVLEEEILVGQDEVYFSEPQTLDRPQLRDHILSLYEDGYSVEDIAESKGLSEQNR